MSTRQQRASIRRNAERSTRPVAPSSGAASSFDAPNHGIDAKSQIMFTESPDLALLDAEYRKLYSPANALERFLVDTLIHDEWRLRRLRCVEANLWGVATFLTQKPGDVQAANSGDAFIAGGGPFDRIQRLINTCERSYHRALKELQRAQSGVGQALPPAIPPANQDVQPLEQPPQPEHSKPSNGKLASVPQNPQTSPPAAPFAAAEVQARSADDRRSGPASGQGLQQSA